jgi:hypothetical protein
VLRLISVYRHAVVNTPVARCIADSDPGRKVCVCRIEAVALDDRRAASDHTFHHSAVPGISGLWSLVREDNIPPFTMLVKTARLKSSMPIAM